MALMTYLLKDRHGTYYFRRIIPPALRPFMPPPWNGKTNFKLTLRTKKPATAKVTASKVLAQCTAAFELAERTRRGVSRQATDAVSHSFDMPSSADIEADTIARALADDEAEREDGDDRRHLQSEEERKAWPNLVPVEFGGKGMADEHHFMKGTWLEEEAAEYRQANSRRNIAIVTAELKSYLRGLGVPIDPSSPSFREAGLAMLRGKVSAYELLLARQAGKVVETPARSTHGSGIGPRLSEALKAWAAGGISKGSKKPGQSAAREAERAVRRCIEWLGDLRLAAIDKPKARDFRDALARLPTRLPHHVAKMSLREIIKLDLGHLPQASATTVNKSLNLVSAIVTHAMREGLLDGIPNYVNPFVGLKLGVDERAVAPRELFDAKDLAAIFSTDIYAKGSRPAGGGGEAAFWLPLISVLSGARQGELAQLRVEDLRQDAESGLWVFDIGTDGGRSIKNAGSRRKVPVHPQLLHVGLLGYRQSVVQSGAADLWPDIRSDNEGVAPGLGPSGSIGT